MNSGNDGQSLAATLGGIAGGLLHYMCKEPDTKRKTKAQRQNEARESEGAIQMGAACGVAIQAIFSGLQISQTKEQEDYLYHYTSRTGSRVILTRRFIKISNSGDGDGVYLSSVPPDRYEFDDFVPVAGGTIPRKMFFRFLKSDLDGVKRLWPLDRHQWLYPGKLWLDGKNWEHGEVQNEGATTGREVAIFKNKHY